MSHYGRKFVQFLRAANAAAEASFAKMREKELTGEFGPRLSARNKNATATFKTREGKVGGFREHLDAATIERMNARMTQVLPSEFGFFQ